MTMNLNYWGNEIYYDNNIFLIRKKYTKLIYRVNRINEFTNNITLLDNYTNTILIEFTDIRTEGDPLNTFIRIFNHHIYYIYNGNRYFKLNKKQIINTFLIITYFNFKFPKP